VVAYVFSPFGFMVWLDYTQGEDTWDNQVFWASGLNGAGTVNYLFNPGVKMNWDGSRWRLPATVENDSSLGSKPPSASSEMAHLYYAELGNIGYPDSGWGLNNKGPFNKLFPDCYWSGTEYANVSYYAWSLYANDGSQNAGSESATLFAMAVRPGQLDTGSTVPEPSTFLLLGAGVGGLVLVRRKSWKL